MENSVDEILVSLKSVARLILMESGVQFNDHS